MPVINITREANDAIRAAAIGTFKEAGKQCINGTWDVPIDAEVLSHLREMQAVGETISDTIVRLVYTRTKKLN